MSDTGQALQLRHPDQFLGFDALSRRYAPYVAEAVETLRSSAAGVIQENFLFGVVDHPQPAFMLLPLMYLALADARGGITRRHRAYFPWQVLTMELIALYDDTVDYTPLRSNRPTYHARYGAASAASFAGYTYSILVEKTAEVAPEVLPLLTRLFKHLCSLEVWEHQSRYPAISEPEFVGWTRHRYDAVHPVISYSLDSALLLHGEAALPYASHIAFGDLQQDVDDLVNVVEEREKNGENDDLKLGIVTYPLLATIRAEPRTVTLLETLWSPYRALPFPPREGDRTALRRCDSATQGSYDELVGLIRQHGVPATVDKMLRDSAASVSATPEALRPAIAPFVYGFLDRHRGLDPRARREVHVPCRSGVMPRVVADGG